MKSLSLILVLMAATNVPGIPIPLADCIGIGVCQGGNNNGKGIGNCDGVNVCNGSDNGNGIGNANGFESSNGIGNSNGIFNGNGAFSSNGFNNSNGIGNGNNLNSFGIS